jgi:hypothetical protein
LTGGSFIQKFLAILKDYVPENTVAVTIKALSETGGVIGKLTMF